MLAIDFRIHLAFLWLWKEHRTFALQGTVRRDVTRATNVRKSSVLCSRNGWLQSAICRIGDHATRRKKDRP
jgi:hypothetical protein